MPRKVRQLIQDLERAGFVDRGGRGSHRNFEHPVGPRVTLSGKPGDDAKPYQEREVQRGIAESLVAEDEDEVEVESDESRQNKP
jgi:predicted RNA binding protein YcfA (HicA-like mRNA interferase family)